MKLGHNHDEVTSWLTEFYADMGDDAHTASEFVDATLEMIRNLELIRANQHLISTEGTVNGELKKLWERLRDLSPATVNHLNAVSGGEPVSEMMYLLRAKYKMPRKDTSLRLMVLSQAMQLLERFGIEWSSQALKSGALVEYLKMLIEAMGLPYDAYELARSYPTLKKPL